MLKNSRYNFFLQGAQGVGKTTLIEALKVCEISGFQVNVVKAITRGHYLSDSLSRESETTDLDFFTYFNFHLSALKKCPYGINVFDRSLIDTIVFSVLKYGKNNPIELLGKEIISTQLQEIHGIIYIPIEFSMDNDGFRNLEVEKQAKFDVELVTIINELGIAHETIVGTVDNRLYSSKKFIVKRILS